MNEKECGSDSPRSNSADATSPSTAFLSAVLASRSMGELLAATWRDYDPTAGLLSITKALTVVGGRLVPKEAKTKKGVRSVALSFARPALDAHRKRMEAEGRDVVGGLIFCDSRGGYLRKSNLSRRF